MFAACGQLGGRDARPPFRPAAWPRACRAAGAGPTAGLEWTARRQFGQKGAFMGAAVRDVLQQTGSLDECRVQEGLAALVPGFNERGG